MKNQKSFLLIALFIATSLFTSCGNDDEAGPTYSFINQNLQGTIDGIPFTLKGGRFEDGFEENEISIDLYDTNEQGDICSILFGEFVNVFFSIPRAVGLYELSFNLDSFDGRTVTLYNPDNSLNIIATEGAVEILSISDTQVTGRMDVRFDEENAVNGNFTVELCPTN